MFVRSPLRKQSVFIPFFISFFFARLHRESFTHEIIVSSSFSNKDSTKLPFPKRGTTHSKSLWLMCDSNITHWSTWLINFSKDYSIFREEINGYNFGINSCLSNIISRGIANEWDYFCNKIAFVLFSLENSFFPSIKFKVLICIDFILSIIPASIIIYLLFRKEILIPPRILGIMSYYLAYSHPVY